jgi:hypothetical protein
MVIVMQLLCNASRTEYIELVECLFGLKTQYAVYHSTAVSILL